MEERKHPLADCQKCPWRIEGAFVPSLIPKGNIKVAVVGEAPGSYEARTGIPFTGPSGELLDRVLKYHGIERSEVALINTAACCPPGKTEKPPKTAVAACSARLEHDLKQANAPIILAVGATGAQAILQDGRKISTLRIGPPRQSRFGPIVSTWHPAYCLRTPDAFPTMVKDIGKLYGKELPPWTPPTYKVFETPEAGMEVLRRLQNVPKIIIDIEVDSEKDIDDAHPEDYDLLCVGIAYAKGQAVVLGPRIFEDEECLRLFGLLLEKCEVGGHNLKFDMLGISPKVGIRKAGFDTMLKSYVLDERPRQHGLKLHAVETLGAPKYDEEIHEYTKGKDGSFAKIPKELLYKYNAYDVGCTWDLDEIQNIQLSPIQHDLHAFLISALNELMHIELSPLHFDEEYNSELEEEFRRELVESEKRLNEFVGYEINPRSPKQVMKWFGDQGMIIETTERPFLEKVIDKIDDENVIKFIQLLFVNRDLVKTLGTYIVGLRKKVKNGRISTTFSLHSTTSGRLASRKPNLQNVKRDKRIRNQFTAKKGKILVQCDYSQVEGRVIATLANDTYLQRVFTDPNVDIFNDMCDQIWGRGNWNKENRVSIKSIFYGYSYGRKAKSIANELKKPVAYATNLMNEFKNLIPGVVAWQAAIKREVLTEQQLDTPFGRKRTFHLITNDNVEDVLNEALSYKPQSIASDICLRAAIRLRPMLKEMFDADIKLLIHDAIVVECDPDLVDQVIEVMQREMVRSGREYTDFVPFKVEATIGFRLGEL